jgi:cytochrome c oxidase subunit 3
MAVNAYFSAPARSSIKTNPVWFTNRVENSGLFWHFVDLVWIFLFPTCTSVAASMTSDHAAT